MKEEFEHESGPASSRTAFERCLVEGDAASLKNSRRARRKAVSVSLAIEVVALAALLVAPLFSTSALPKVSPPAIPIPLGRPYHSANQNRQTRRASRTSETIIPFILQPPRIPTEIRHVTDANVQQNDNSDANTLPPSSIIGITGLDGISARNTQPLPPPEKRKPDTNRPIHVSGGVEEARLIHRVDPVYPWIAKQAHREGTVVLHAIIGRDGRIAELETVSGDFIFVRAALDAVQQWRYSPTMLDGQPVEVETSITVRFVMQH